MIRVKDLQGGALPKEFIALLPTHCDKCGAETEITETLTILKCTNTVCGEKSVHRLVALLQDIDVKNMGESKCRQFLEHFELTNPYAIFMYEPSDGVLFNGCSQEFSEAIFEQMETKRKMLLWEYVKIGNLPGIRDSARKLFAEYDSLEEFYDDLEAGGIAFVQETLGIKRGSKKKVKKHAYLDKLDLDDFYDRLTYYKSNFLDYYESEDREELDGIPKDLIEFMSVFGDYESFFDDLDNQGKSYLEERIEHLQQVMEIENNSEEEAEDDSLSVKSIQIYNTLIFHKEELMDAIGFVEIKQLTTPVINLCISTSVGKPYKSKKDFVNAMNEMFGHKVHLNFLSSISKDLHFLVWSKEGAETSKVKKVKAHNEKVQQMELTVDVFDNPESQPHTIYIVTGEEFRGILEDY